MESCCFSEAQSYSTNTKWQLPLLLDHHPGLFFFLFCFFIWLVLKQRVGDRTARKKYQHIGYPSPCQSMKKGFSEHIITTLGCQSAARGGFLPLHCQQLGDSWKYVILFFCRFKPPICGSHAPFVSGRCWRSGHFFWKQTKFMRQHADISHSYKIGQCLLCIQNIQYQSPSSYSLFSCKLH